MRWHWLPIALLVAGCEKAPQPPAAPAGSLDSGLASLIQERRERVLQSPRSGEFWGGLGQAFHAAELHSQARECYARAIRLSPASAKWRHLAAILQLQDDPQAAVAHFERAAELGETPGAGSLSRLRLARALVERARFDEAEREIARLLQAEPGHAGAQLEKARIHFARREFDAAFLALESCGTNAATARPALSLLAQIRHAQGDREEAANYARQASAATSVEWPDPYLREVLALRTDRQAVEDMVNRLLSQGRTEEAKAAMGSLLKAAPNSPETLLLLARMRYQQRDCAEAENILRRQLGIQPDSLNGLIQLGLALLCQEKWADAVEPLRKAVTLKPDYAQAHFNLGIALSRSGQRTKAIESFRAALRCTPGDPVIHSALADELRRAGETQEADHHAQRAAALRQSTN